MRVAFYLERLPAEVCSIATCNDYTHKASADELARLEMTEDDLASGEAGYAEDDFPTRLAVGGGEVSLAYRFAPGEPDDGISLRVEAGMLGQLDAHALEWLVPGFFEDKCLALVRALPKTFRRRLAPARDRLDPVIPLLAEYFFEDWAKIAAVLGDAESDDGPINGRFLKHSVLKAPPGLEDGDALPRFRWEVRSEDEGFDYAGLTGQ